MKLVTLKLNDELWSELRNLLIRAGKDKVEIVEEWDEQVQELREARAELEKPDAKFITLDELDEQLKEVIARYEN